MTLLHGSRIGDLETCGSRGAESRMIANTAPSGISPCQWVFNSWGIGIRSGRGVEGAQPPTPSPGVGSMKFEPDRLEPIPPSHPHITHAPPTHPKTPPENPMRAGGRAGGRIPIEAIGCPRARPLQKKQHRLKATASTRLQGLPGLANSLCPTRQILDLPAPSRLEEQPRDPGRLRE